MCESENIDFIKFEDVNLNINLTNTVTKLKREANEFILKIADDLVLIESQEYSIEMIVEYKKTLNASKAITDTLNRKEAEKQAKIQANQKLWDNRKIALRNLLMVYNSVTKTFDYNETIFIKENEAKELQKDDFVRKLQELKSEINEYFGTLKIGQEYLDSEKVKIEK